MCPRIDGTRAIIKEKLGLNPAWLETILSIISIFFSNQEGLDGR